MEWVERIVARMMAPLHRRVMLMVGRAILTAVNDGERIQRVQLTGLADEVHNGVPRFQHYGFTSVPPAGALAVVLYQAGKRDHGAVIAEEHMDHRPTGLLPGEAMLYDQLGKFVKLGADGTLTIHAPKIVIEADESLELYAGTRLRQDVHGYGTETRHEGGTDWTAEGWTIGAIVTPADNPIEPPRIGS